MACPLAGPFQGKAGMGSGQGKGAAGVRESRTAGRAWPRLSSRAAHFLLLVPPTGPSSPWRSFRGPQAPCRSPEQTPQEGRDSSLQRLPDGPPAGRGSSSRVLPVASVLLTSKAQGGHGGSGHLSGRASARPPLPSHPPPRLFPALATSCLKQPLPARALFLCQRSHRASSNARLYLPTPPSMHSGRGRGPRLLLVLFSQTHCFLLQRVAGKLFQLFPAG